MLYLFSFCDYALSGSFGFQDPACALLYGIINLHDNIIFFLAIIASIVIYILNSSMYNKDFLIYLSHGNSIELLLTIFPALILLAIGIPSLKLLYMIDEILDPELTVKTIAYQLALNYEYSDYENDIIFDSFMTATEDLEFGQLRKLTVDNYMVLPINTSIRILVTSNDVIHSLAIPSLAIKCDAFPGRLNSVGVIINRESTFYGQCSELCGVLHSAMPIGVKAVNLPTYLNLVKSQE